MERPGFLLNNDNMFIINFFPIYSFSLIQSPHPVCSDCSNNIVKVGKKEGLHVKISIET